MSIVACSVSGRDVVGVSVICCRLLVAMAVLCFGANAVCLLAPFCDCETNLVEIKSELVNDYILTSSMTPAQSRTHALFAMQSCRRCFLLASHHK